MKNIEIKNYELVELLKFAYVYGKDSASYGGLSFFNLLKSEQIMKVLRVEKEKELIVYNPFCKCSYGIDEDFGRSQEEILNNQCKWCEKRIDY